jgi:hypothetical protein
MGDKIRDQPHEPGWAHALRLARSAQRCGARTRRGTCCQSPAIAGRARCRLHGGLSPGAPSGPRNGRYVSGYYSQQATADRRNLRILIKRMRRTLGEL